MKKIMVADTSQTIKNVANSLLRQKGYDVICTSDGLQAWDFVNTDKPNLVLAGIELSGMSGMELCRQISDRAVSGDIPVIMLLGPNDKFTKEELMTAGAKGRLMKPFSPNDLMRVVEKLLGKVEVTPVADETKLNLKVDNSENETGYNLKWDDIKDIDQPEIKEEEPKIESLQAQSNDRPFELAPENESELPKTENKNQSLRSRNLAAKDDYDWFASELKKEIGDYKNVDSRETDLPVKPDYPEPNQIENSVEEKIDFNDLNSTASEHILEEQKFDESDHLSTSVKTHQTAASSVGLTEEDINRLAEKVSKKLVEALASNIDKELILKLIKSSIEE
jgi:DNA-binding response OmpR family regulator